MFLLRWNFSFSYNSILLKSSGSNVPYIYIYFCLTSNNTNLAKNTNNKHLYSIYIKYKNTYYQQ